MIHFNELYITEDGKNLVIDAAIDDFDIYKNCYIERISVQVKTDCTSSDQYITVFPDDMSSPLQVLLQGGVIMVDMNSDGKITPADEEKSSWAVNVLQDLDLSKYDTNGDGVINYLDLAEIIQEDTQSQSVPRTISANNSSTGDHTGGNELDYEDRDALTNIIRDAMEAAGYTSEQTDIVLLYLSKVTSDITVTYRYKRVRRCISVKSLLTLININNSDDWLFLVKAEASVGSNAAAIESLGCGWDNYISYGLAYNDKKLYDNAINLASSYGDSCDDNDSRKFMDFVLRYYAFIFAIKCGDIDQACYYWNNYIKDNNVKQSSVKGRCGCHGAHR